MILRLHAASTFSNGGIVTSIICWQFIKIDTTFIFHTEREKCTWSTCLGEHLPGIPSKVIIFDNLWPFLACDHFLETYLNIVLVTLTPQFCICSAAAFCLFFMQLEQRCHVLAPPHVHSAGDQMTHLTEGWVSLSGILYWVFSIVELLLVCPVTHHLNTHNNTRTRTHKCKHNNIPIFIPMWAQYISRSLQDDTPLLPKHH